MRRNKNMLKLENITVLFDDLKALDHVNMEFMEGKITGIIGTNGSGKSTLMKVMTKLLKPQEGSVYLDQQLIQDKKKDLFAYRQEVNMVFQNPEQQLFYTIAKDDIRMALENLGYSKEECDKRVQEAIELMDIKELQDRPVQYLSYGQKKKVAIQTSDFAQSAPFEELELSVRDKNFDIGEIVTIDEYIKYIIVNYQDKFPDTELSKKLGISRKSLWEKRKKYDVSKKK